jgi:flagellar assembly protein FliH
VEDAVVALKNARNDIFEQVEESVKDLSLFIAEHIIKAEIDRNGELFINIVRDTLSKVQYQDNITVKVSKTEFEKLFSDPDSDIVTELRNSGVDVKQDMSLKSGECIVETEYGTINSSIQKQLSRMGFALREG